MCEICDYVSREIGLDKMREDQVFSAFDKLISEGKLADLGEVDPESPRYAVSYRCLACKAVWTFVVPDHAFKGGISRST